MNISKQLARNIVKNLKDVLKQEINFIDTEGIIIASTDEERIRTLHEGAKIVLDTKKEVFISEDGQFKGTKRGINAPVYFEQHIIGIIGLTGGKEVKKYAEILKKMTEILIKEAYLKDFTFQLRERHRLAIESLMFPFSHFDSPHLIELDFSSPYYVVVGQLPDNQELYQEQITPLLELLERVFSYYSQALFTVHRQQIIILVNRISRALLISLLDKVQTNFDKSYQLQLNFGIGSLCYTEQETPQSFLHAQHACEWITFHQSVNEIRFFEDLDLGILLPAIPSGQRSLYVNRILKSLTEEEVHLFKKTLTCFSKNNGSIKKCAEELFIHKNTLQYRLNKLHSLTGYNPRNYDDYLILKLAFLLIQI